MMRRSSRTPWALGLVLLLGLSPAPSRSDPEAASPRPLVAGSVSERHLSVGETHRYSIELREGEYLQVLVEQHDVDVVLALAAPDGSVVLETDGPSGASGPDPLAVVAATTGLHELRLTASYALPRSRYALLVEAPREPGPADRLRVKAVHDAAQGGRLFRKDLQKSLELFREAAAGWGAVGDRRMQMWAGIMVGIAHGQGLEQYLEAAEWFQRSLSTAVELADPWAEARARYNLAQCQRNLGQLDEAKSNYERSLALYTAIGHDEDAAKVLASLGNFHSLAAEPQLALDHLREALRRFQAAGNARGEANAFITLGSAYLRLGDPELALEQFRSALPPLDRDPSYHTANTRGIEVVRARATSGMARAHVALGDLGEARKAYATALSLYRSAGAPFSEAEAYLGLGNLHVTLGELAEAQGMFESALAAYRARANPQGEGVALCSLGDVHHRMARPDAAGRAFEEAAALAAPGGVLVRLCSDQGRARLARDAGQLEQAFSLARSALGTVESARSTLASHRTRAAALAHTQWAYDLAIDILMRRHEAEPSAGHDAAAFEVSERARARSLLELLGEGGIDVRGGVAPELLAEERSLRQRLNTAAATQAEALDAGRADRAEVVQRELDGLSAQLAETEARIRRTSPRYAALTQAQPLGLDEIRARVLDPDTQLLQYWLGEERSYLWVVSSGRLEGFRLAPRGEIEAAARRLHALLSAPPKGGAGADPALGGARRELSRLVLDHAAGALGASRLLVVAPGALQYVPLGSLPLPDGSPVLARFEVVSAPSASVIAVLRAEAAGRERAEGAVAVFADPVFEPSDPRIDARRGGPSRPEPGRVGSRGGESGQSVERALRSLRGRGAGGGLGRLPFSRREADAIADLAPAGKAFKATGFDANREAATSPRLARYRIVHFATHGVLNTRRPELSGVVLSLYDRYGRRQDGFLRLHDVYGLRLNADLAVLSGCQTGLGRDLGGEGLVGLTRGFMYAGARGVVASSWPVDDESTAELMERFYRGMLKEGRRPAEALRAAQLEMSRHRRWSAPFHWAGFVLQGEWR